MARCIHDIGLPVVISNRLERNGIDTVEKLINMKKRDLLECRTISFKSVMVIQNCLKAEGLGLGINTTRLKYANLIKEYEYHCKKANEILECINNQSEFMTKIRGENHLV